MLSAERSHFCVGLILSVCFSFAQVVIKCPRTGGAFGGKIFRGIPVSCAAALACAKLGRPVRIFNTRTADMAQQSEYPVPGFPKWVFELYWKDHIAMGCP